MLERYSLYPRKEKKMETLYSDEKTFETPKTVGKVCMKTKELEFGGKIGMTVLNSSIVSQIIYYYCMPTQSFKWMVLFIKLALLQAPHPRKYKGQPCISFCFCMQNCVLCQLKPLKNPSGQRNPL